MTHTATYSPDDNKIRIYPAHRLSAEDYANVKAHGFKWAPKQEIFVAPMWTPSRADFAELMCGEIGDEDKSLTERAEERAERFEEYHEKRAQDAESAREAVARIADGIPMGQPILVGHHSEKHARKDAERIENGMRKAVKMWETAKYWTDRAAGAIAHAAYKERADVRARRIKGIEADKRKQEKYIAEGEKWLKMWNTPELTLDKARHIANYCNLTVTMKNADGTPNTNGGWSAYNVLCPDEERYKECPAKTVQECIDAANQAYPRMIAHCRRWIEHYNNRLAYERAMLGESGYIQPPKSPTKAVLPILNYGGEVQYKDRWNRGAVITTQAHGMTRAEFAKIYKDYKGTFISADGTHRIRCAIVGAGNARGLCAVYLTDSKQHTKPGGELVTREQQETAARITRGTAALDAQVAKAREVSAHNKAVIRGDSVPVVAPAPKPEENADFQAMRESLKAGIQVISAPQLFPTPKGLAQRMADMLEIKGGERVLEPSAGTGMLLGALGGKTFNAPLCVSSSSIPDNLHAVEVNQELAKRLRVEFPFTNVHCGDFLQMNGNLGTFHKIIMNPPFADGADIKHIQHAAGFLKPGGRLVAICANGPRQRDQLMPLATEWIDLPQGTFKEAGTMVNTALLIIEG